MSGPAKHRSESGSSSRDETLARLDAIQARGRDRLADAEMNRALLVELLEASCLLELAKLDTTRLDPASYLQLAVDVVAQMCPVQGVAATVSGAGIHPIDVHAGVRPEGGSSHPLVTAGLTIGALVTGPVQADLGIPEQFFESVTAQVAHGLASALHAAQLRREAATAIAARVASGLTDEDKVEGLDELVLSLAAFPSVIAAELVIDHSALGPPLRLRSGYWDGDGQPHSLGSVTLDLAGSGRLTARVRSADENPPDEQAVYGVLEHLACSLERIAHTHALREQAETEPMTGLGNRRRLQRALDQALSRAERYGENVAVLLLDLDRFKPVNDELGHDMGDAVIVACAQSMRQRTRSYDELIRLGGDEFVIVAPVPDVLDALRLADDVREGIAARGNALLPENWGLTATIGVSIFPEAGRTAEELLRAADVALYRAKDAGRDGVMLAEPAPVRGDAGGRSFFTSPGE